MGEVVTDIYTQGGYFHRTPGAIHGGSEEAATEMSVWFMRVLQEETTTSMDACVAPPSTDAVGP